MVHRLVTACVLLGAAGAAFAQGLTVRASVTHLGAQSNGGSGSPDVSADGRWVVFASTASNLVPGDSNGWSDVFVFDRWVGTLERVSVRSDGTQANGASGAPSISSDGRIVAFESVATNLVSSDTNNRRDIFVRDRQARTTTRVSVGSSGSQGNNHSFRPDLSADGRLVSFDSQATNLVTSDTNARLDVFVRDRQTNTTTRVSLAGASTQANGDSAWARISGDGRFVAFESAATNLAPNDTNALVDVFVRDRSGASTVRASIAQDGTQANGSSSVPDLDADGSHVAFHSAASNLTSGDTNGRLDVFVKNLADGSVELVSRSAGGVVGNGNSAWPRFSPDGGFVGFESLASNLVAGTPGGVVRAYLKTLGGVGIELVSVDSVGLTNGADGLGPVPSNGASVVAFAAERAGLVPSDDNGAFDVFARRRGVGHDPGTGIALVGNSSARPFGFWRTSNATVTGWVSITSALANPPATLADMNGDGFDDVVTLRSSDRRLLALLWNGSASVGTWDLGALGSGWTLVGAADIDSNGTDDLVARRSSDGALGAYLFNGAGANVGWLTLPKPSPSYVPAGLGDINGDGRVDLVLFAPGTRQVAAWLLDRNFVWGWQTLFQLPAGFAIRGLARFDDTPGADLLVEQTSTRTISTYLLNRGSISTWRRIGTVGSAWTVFGVGRL